MLQAWKQGTHIPEVAQERLVCTNCSVMVELMIPQQVAGVLSKKGEYLAVG